MPQCQLPLRVPTAQPLADVPRGTVQGRGPLEDRTRGVELHSRGRALEQARLAPGLEVQEGKREAIPVQEMQMQEPGTGAGRDEGVEE